MFNNIGVIKEMKSLQELKVYEVLLISLVGLALANMLSDSLKTLFFKTLCFNESSFKDRTYAFLLPLLILLIIVFLTKPPETSLF